eukprot:5692802-Lingulodinium_polyedra.AAC.1
MAKSDLNPEELKEVSVHIQGAMEATVVPKKRFRIRKSQRLPRSGDAGRPLLPKLFVAES